VDFNIHVETVSQILPQPNAEKVERHPGSICRQRADQPRAVRWNGRLAGARAGAGHVSTPSALARREAAGYRFEKSGPYPAGVEVRRNEWLAAALQFLSLQVVDFTVDNTCSAAHFS
jgi:hypothetical protein